MLTGDLKDIIEVVKRIVGDGKRDFKIECDPHTVVQHTFERQGVNKVLDVLEGISNGNIKPKDYLHKE